MSRRAVAYADVVRGASRGFGFLFVGGLIEPLVARIFEPLAYVWLPLVAVVAFAAAAIVATPPDTPVHAWRQGAVAAVGSYLVIVPLVRVAAGELPILQLALTSVTAVLVGGVVGLARTAYAARPVDGAIPGDPVA